VELYEASPPADVAKLTSAAKLEPIQAEAAAAGAGTGGAEKHEEGAKGFSAGSDDADPYGRRGADVWRNRCLALLNNSAHLSDTTLQITRADDFDNNTNGAAKLDRDTCAEAAVHAVERGTQPELKVLPVATVNDSVSPSFSAVTSDASGMDVLHSQLSHQGGGGTLSGGYGRAELVCGGQGGVCAAHVARHAARLLGTTATVIHVRDRGALRRQGTRQRLDNDTSAGDTHDACGRSKQRA
jgi:hypothetical protein